MVQQGELLTWLGRGEEGADWIVKAMRLNPHHPVRFWSHLGRAHLVARHYEDALRALMHLSAPDDTQYALIAASHGWLGDRVAAEAHLGKL